jgi:hypothetical protein
MIGTYIRATALTFIGLATTAFGADPATHAAKNVVTSRLISTDGNLVEVLDHTQMIFRGPSAMPVKDPVTLDLKGKRYVTSPNGNYVGTCSWYMDKAAPITIYDSLGKKISEFPVDLTWTLATIADSGKTLTLAYQSEEIMPPHTRLVTVEGKLLVDAPDSHIQLSSVGGVQWGVVQKPRRYYAQLFDAEGKKIARYEYPNGDYKVLDVSLPPEDGSALAFFDAPQDDTFSSRILLWDIKEQKTKFVEIPKKFGEAQPEPALSPNGKFLVVRLGDAGVGVLTVQDGTWSRLEDFGGRSVDGGTIQRLLSATIDREGRILATCMLKGSPEKKVQIHLPDPSPSK